MLNDKRELYDLLDRNGRPHTLSGLLACIDCIEITTLANSVHVDECFTLDDLISEAYSLQCEADNNGYYWDYNERTNLWLIDSYGYDIIVKNTEYKAVYIESLDIYVYIDFNSGYSGI